MKIKFTLLFILISTTTYAAPMVDFSQGTLGYLGSSYAVADNLILIEGFGGSLYRRNEPNDHGLGVCGIGENCQTEDNELDGSEAMILYLPPNHKWTGLWLSSVDGEEAGFYMLEIWPIGPIQFVAGEGAFATTVENRIPLNSFALELRIWPDIKREDNDFLVWGVDIQDTSVPEPSSLVLLGIGLGLVARRIRR